MKLVNTEFDVERINRSVFRLLGQTELCSLATCCGADSVHINTAFFAFDRELCLYFISDPGSRHAVNLQKTPAAAVTVFDSHQCWGEDNAGLQLFGTAARATGPEHDRAQAEYARRFRRYDEFRGAGRRMPGFQGLCLFRFETAELTLLDEAEFGGAVLVAAEVRRVPGTP